MMKALLIGAAALALSAGSASATVVIEIDDNGSADQIAVHNDGNQTGTLIDGQLGIAGPPITFESTSNLKANGSGVAKVQADDSDDLFQDVSIYFTPPSTSGFNSINFTLFTQEAKPIVVDFTLDYLGGGGSDTGQLTLLSNLSKFNLYSTDSVYSKITFNVLSGAGIENIEQVALGPASAIPEPTSWMLMIAGFGLVGSALRASRRKPAAVFTA